MKKIYFLAASLMLSVGAMAQIQNGGFETWAPGVAPMTTDPHPGNWQCPMLAGALPGGIDNDLSAFGGTITIGGVAGSPTTQSTTDPFELSANISLQTFTLSGLGSVGLPDGIYASSIQQMVTYNAKTNGVSFEYKTNLVTGDKALAFITVYGAGVADSVIGQGVKLIAANSATWVLDTADITYFSTSNIVDSIEIIFASSQNLLQGAPTPSTDGSIFEIDDVKILTPPVYADPVTNIVASDVSDNHNGTDLQVTFDAAADETTVSEYRVFAIKMGYSASDWSSLPAGTYEVVTPTGAASYTVNFQATSVCLGVSGGAISPYTIAEDSVMDIFVLSVADGTIATADQVAGPDSTVLDSHLGITNLSMEANTIKVYPNPASNFVNIAFQNSEMASFVNVYSMTGQLMKSVPASIVTKVDLSSFDSGMYFFRVLDENKQIIKTDKFQVVK